jgi:DNA-binding HxlR family transcriptional regulator
MPLRSDWSDELCPIRRSLDVLGDGWVLLIVRDVLHGRGRFDELRDSLGISEAVLSRRLHAMVAAGLLMRVEYRDSGRKRQAYAATESAAELLPILQQLAIWGERNTTLPEQGAHMTMIHRTCGEETFTAELCSACGQQLLPQEMTWVKPWKNARDNLVSAGSLAP